MLVPFFFSCFILFIYFFFLKNILNLFCSLSVSPCLWCLSLLRPKRHGFCWSRWFSGWCTCSPLTAHSPSEFKHQLFHPLFARSFCQLCDCISQAPWCFGFFFVILCAFFFFFNQGTCLVFRCASDLLPVCHHKSWPLAPASELCPLFFFFFLLILLTRELLNRCSGG